MVHSKALVLLYHPAFLLSTLPSHAHTNIDLLFSLQYSVKAGQTLKGAMKYDKSTDSYDLSQTIVETGETSSQNIPCQTGKKVSIVKR